MSPLADQGLPEDWQEQIVRAYTVFGAGLEDGEMASRHITPAMRAGWAKQRRRGRGHGGGQWMRTTIARLPVLPPLEEIRPGEKPGARVEIVLVEPEEAIEPEGTEEEAEGAEEEVGGPVVGPAGPAGPAV